MRKIAFARVAGNWAKHCKFQFEIILRHRVLLVLKAPLGLGHMFNDVNAASVNVAVKGEMMDEARSCINVLAISLLARVMTITRYLSLSTPFLAVELLITWLVEGNSAACLRLPGDVWSSCRSCTIHIRQRARGRGPRVLQPRSFGPPWQW